MNFPEAVAAGFRNYVNFSGRASRSEYWYWILFYILVMIATLLIDAALAGGSSESLSLVNTIASLALFLPNVSVAVRRLHDVDRSGWWILIGLIPLVGWIILLVWYCTRGTLGPNRFGPDPLGGM